MTEHTLIAGIGNIFLGDDGFGVEVAHLLQRSPCEQGVVVRDFGIRSLDLAYALLDQWQTVVLVDAVSRGKAPGTLYLLQPDLDAIDATAQATIDSHSMDPVRVLAAARAMGDITASIFIVACEPQDFGEETDGRMGLSAPVAAAVPAAADMVGDLLERIPDLAVA